MVGLLVATKDEAYLLDTTSSDGEPELIHSSEPCIRATTVWEGAPVLALEGGTVVVFNEARPDIYETRVADTVASITAVPGAQPRFLIGTEPPHVYTWEMDDSPAQPNESFASLDCRSEWYTPWGGPAAVRSFAVTPHGWVYADVHVGSVMRSGDGGETWEPVTPELHVDVHQVGTSPAAPDRVYANTADGVWVSDDRGGSWRHRTEDRKRYGRALAIHPEDPDLVLCTVSDGPHGDDVHGALYRSADAGETWTHVTDGFPASAKDNINTFRVVFDPGGTAWAAVEQALYCGGSAAETWREVWRAPDEIELLAT